MDPARAYLPGSKATAHVNCLACASIISSYVKIHPKSNLQAKLVGQHTQAGVLRFRCTALTPNPAHNTDPRYEGMPLHSGNAGSQNALRPRKGAPTRGRYYGSLPHGHCLQSHRWPLGSHAAQATAQRGMRLPAVQVSPDTASSKSASSYSTNLPP